MGYLLSSFLWTYAIFILPIGIMLRSHFRTQHQFDRSRAMVDRHGGDRRRI
jgi:hypothetical protein